MSKQHGGSIVGERLKAQGVTHIFTLCGGHISPLLVGAQDQGVQVVDVRHEASAAFAADAMSRMTGIPGVVAVTAGPGVTNTVTAVKNAQMAEVPMIIFGGATATILKGRGSLQDIDQLSIMTPITKWATRVTSVAAIAPTIDHAFEVATRGVPGPVFIELPVDLLYPEETVKQWYMDESGVKKMKGPAKVAVELALKGHLARIFRAPYIDVLDAKLAPQMASEIARQPINNAKLSQLDEALVGAEKPVLIVGSQAVSSMTPHQAQELANAITELGIPTFLGGSARGLLGQHSDIQFRHKRSAALKEADLVLVAGFPFDFRLGYGQKINRKATLISVNLDSTALKKNRRPQIAIQDHPGHLLTTLPQRVTLGKSRYDSWFGRLRERETMRDEEIAALGTPNKEAVNPINFFLKLEEQLADDSVLVVDGGDFVATGAYIVRPRKPLSWLDPGVFGTLGVGGGFALGAASARPDAETWIIWGDGSSAYSLAEFDAYVRQGMAPIAVVGTDASWAQIARDQVEILGTPLGTELRQTDYQDVAKGYGGEGILVKHDGQIDAAIKKAKKLAQQGKPVLINLLLAKSDFRKGSLSI